MPNMRFTGFTPNQAAVVKLMAFGEVRVGLIELSSLKKAMGDKCTSLEFLKDLVQMAEPDLKKLQENGAKIQWHKHSRGEILYIPQGWVTVEHVHTSNNLVYGIRKSFMRKSAGAVENFKLAVDLYRASDRPTKRLDSIVQLMG